VQRGCVPQREQALTDQTEGDGAAHGDRAWRRRDRPGETCFIPAAPCEPCEPTDGDRLCSSLMPARLW
jgi:hypothetical protein